MFGFLLLMKVSSDVVNTLKVSLVNLIGSGLFILMKAVSLYIIKLF